MAGDKVSVEVCYATPDRQTIVAVELDAGATVGTALAAVASREPFAGLHLLEIAVGVYGQRVDRQRVLEDGDRVELYRSLAMDPKEARRHRGSR